MAEVQENPQVSQLPPHITPEQASAHFELGIALSLALWPALTLAVSNNWGGPDSADKRDWLGGEILSLFESDPETDVEDVETVLLQVMQDEFEVAVDDDSGFDIADLIMRLKGQCGRGEFAEVLKMKERWDRKGGNGSAGVEAGFRRVEGGEDDQDTDGSDEEDEEGDVEMGDAPTRQPKEKVEPEIDEDGFQTVVSKKKR